MIIIMVTTASALLLAGVGFVVADSILFRSYMKRDLSALAQMAADNSTAAVQFNDPRAASETLSALRARTHLAAACIYSARRERIRPIRERGGERRLSRGGEIQ